MSFKSIIKELKSIRDDYEYKCNYPSFHMETKNYDGFEVRSEDQKIHVVSYINTAHLPKWVMSFEFFLHCWLGFMALPSDQKRAIVSTLLSCMKDSALRDRLLIEFDIMEQIVKGKKGNK